MSGEPLRSPAADLDDELRATLTELYEEGRRAAERFTREARLRGWHPFAPADYETVERALLPRRRPGQKFLELGSATGVITIMADLLGFDAYGTELDPELVDIARDLAHRFDSRARFAAGSFLPEGYRWVSSTGDPRLGTLGHGEPAYAELGQPIEAFDLVFGYPWDGEQPIMHDLVLRRGRPGALLLVYSTQGVRVYQDGEERTDLRTLRT